MTEDRSILTNLTRLHPLWTVLLCLTVCGTVTGRAHASKAGPADLRYTEAMSPLGGSPRPPPPAHDFTELLWRFATGGSIEATPAVAGGVVYFGSADHHVYALDAAGGELLWRYETGGPVYHSPTVVEGVLYIGSGDSRLYALEAASGELVVDIRCR